MGRIDEPARSTISEHPGSGFDLVLQTSLARKQNSIRRRGPARLCAPDITTIAENPRARQIGRLLPGISRAGDTRGWLRRPEGGINRRAVRGLLP